MSEFSLDDILDKYGHKDGGGSKDEADDILNDILGEETRSKSRRSKSHTAELSRADTSSSGSTETEKADKAEKRLQEFEEKKQATDRRRAEFEEQQRQAEEKRRADLAEKQRIAEEKKRAELAEMQRKAEEEKRIKEEIKQAKLEKQKRIEEEKKLQHELEKEREKERIAEEERKKAEEERLRQEAEEQKQREAAEKERSEKEKKRRERNDEMQWMISEKDRRERRRKRKLDDEERKREQEELERQQEADRQHAEEEEAMRQRLAEQETARRKIADEESEWLYATKNIVLQDAPIELPTADREDVPAAEAGESPSADTLELEKNLRQQKIEIDAQKLLIKETQLEDPEDFLNAMNPYEFGKKAGVTEQIETISAQQLSGDTQKIDPALLRELSKDDGDTRSVENIIDGATRVMPDLSPQTKQNEEDSEEIKEFVPKSHDTKEVRKRTDEEERLIRSINDTIEQKRLADLRDTNPASSFDTGPFDKIVLPTRTAKFESAGNSVLESGEIPMSDPAIAEQKLKELSSKRKRRISNFVLEDISDDEIDYDDESYDIPAEEEAAGIWTDLVETHKSLHLRFILLFIVTAGLITANILQRIFIRQKIGLFGNELGLLSNDGVVFANLICGVIGMILCSSVITSGITKLFRGRADCDSVCSVSCLLSLAAAVLMLVDTNDMEQGRAFIYIPTALLGLLFNSAGKLNMIRRAKKNYKFINSEGSKYYAEVIDGQSEASAFTKGAVSELPYLVTMRKTELLTDFLKKSYCEDMADRVSRRLVPISLIIGALLGLLVYFIPNGTTVNNVTVYDHNMYWAVSVAVGVICAMAPFSMMFMVNNPFRRASKRMLKNGCALLGYTSAEEFGEANSVLVDAATLFPKSAVECTNIKPCKLQNSLNSISLDMAIILAASLAIKSGSVLSGLFFDMIGGKKEMIANIDGCVYEDNMGVMGWYGNKRIIMGSREHMKQHSIKIPEMGAIAKYLRNGSDSVYLAVGGELAVIFFIRLAANPAVRANIRELTSKGVSVVLKTTDSLITNAKIADLFDVDPEKIKIIGASLHDLYNECTKYTTEGCGAMSCSGSFVSLAKGITSSKKLIKDVSMSRGVMLFGVIAAVLLMILSAFSTYTFTFIPEIISLWHILWLLIMLFLQMFRRY